ncbi:MULTISPECIES: TerD family protein [unclassified Saccharibacter]|uniref:TerD family protein n=1 Tax=unclassified Saccharibacter TaxID=2648722 RepID=UPI0013242849|nr:MULTISPECIES: TerD family protein [unclassified Saccharibacter]MXV35179.1 hypothetical protein [Saccharibacter sp. EH611]MXV57274.1 hypothetical protein [Saccharibacter sp. EH70]MXV64865.1 hypothetical protein [Saccharibacter sp. EH60]
MSELAFNLSKGMTFDLEKARPGLKKVRVALKWKKVKQGISEADADLTVVVLGSRAAAESDSAAIAQGQKDAQRKIYASDPAWVLYYNSPQTTLDDGTAVKATPGQEIVHWGDNRTGGDFNGVDGEQVDINFEGMPEGVMEVSILGTIYEGMERNQNWNALEAVLEITDLTDDRMIARYELEHDFPTDTAVQVGAFIRTGPATWEFQAIGSGSRSGLGHFLSYWS